MLHENKHISFFLKLGYFLLIILLLCLTARYGLSLGWPFLTAMLFSAIITKPVNFISKKTPLPRGLTTALFTLAILGVSSLCLYLLASFIFYRSKSFIDYLPYLADDIQQRLRLFETALDNALHEIFPMLKDIPFISLDSLLSQGSAQIDFMGLFSTVSSAAGSIPGALFTVVFIFMGTYFFTAQRDEIKLFLSNVISPSAFEAWDRLKEFLYKSVFRWIKAQLILICITCAEMTVAFMLLKQPYAFPLAAAISIVDALPILGVGTVLIPWSFFCLLTGSFEKALWLIAIYVLVLCVRNSLEPKIVGEKIGLNPFVTLLSLYVGFRLGGFFGMVFIPVAVLSILHLQELGYIQLWPQR